MTRAQVGASVVAVVIALSAPEAGAFVRTRTGAGKGTAWRVPKVTMHVPVLAADRPIGMLTSADVLVATTASAARWTHAEVSCTSLEASVVQDAPLDALAEVDGQNNLIFRDDSWEPKTFDKQGKPLGEYEPNQLALTSVFVRTKSGEIAEADIEINAFSHPKWELTDDRSKLLADGAIDLQNTLTHELGHVFGLAHSCWDPATGPQPLDRGVPVPECGEHPELVEAAMAPTAPPGDLGKRALHDDDRSAVCAVYPFGKPVALDPLDDGGCAVAGSSSDGAAARATGLALLALVLARRFRRLARERLE